MDITQVSILHHIGIVLIGLWILSACNCSHPVVYLISFIYLFLVNERYTLRLRRKLHFQERKQSYQRRLLSDSETVRWLNHAVEKIWPICMEEIASQNFLLPIIPWFLDKYKPWTAEKAVIENLYLGRSPPIFTEIRVLGQSTDDDHLVLELGMNFLSADDMNAALAVKLRKRLGFGMWAKMHITGMHVEGKVLVGVKFLRQWPFLGRLRVCFVEPPYFQMTVKPLFNHGIDVTELPGIAGWLDNLLAVAFDQTLVEPNMLVVDVEKFVSAPTEKWFSVYEKRPIAFARVEILEGADMKPSDLNGLADPYVKGQFGPYRFRTKIQRKTLCPKWQEEFKIPICTWESLNELRLEVRDKDHFVDDTLGDCSVKISELRDGQRHDMWLPLQNIKVGRLHLAITVTGVDEKGEEQVKDVEVLHKTEEADLVTSEDAVRQDIERTTPLEKVPKGADELEPINIEGQERTGIWVHHPGNEIPPTWEPRKGRSRLPETQLLPGVITSHNSDDSSDEENPEGNKVSTIRRSLRKIGSLFHRRPKGDASSDKGAIPSPRANIRAVGEKGTAVTIIVEDNFRPKDVQNAKDSPLTDNDEGVSPGKSHNIKGVAKSFLKQAGGGLKHVLSQKGSHKSKGGADLTMSGKEMNEDSSTDESIPTSSREYTPKSDGGLVIQGTLLSSKASPERRQECLQTGSMNSENDIDGLPTGKECLEPADIEQDSVNENLRKTSVRRKVSFEGINPVDHPVSEKSGSLHQEGKGESPVSVAVEGNTEIQKL